MIQNGLKKPLIVKLQLSSRATQTIVDLKKQAIIFIDMNVPIIALLLRAWRSYHTMYSLLLRVWKSYHTVNMVDEVNTTALPPSDKEALCYLCLDGGDDESSQP